MYPRNNYLSESGMIQIKEECKGAEYMVRLQDFWGRRICPFSSYL